MEKGHNLDIFTEQNFDTIKIKHGIFVLFSCLCSIKSKKVKTADIMIKAVYKITKNGRFCLRICLPIIISIRAVNCNYISSVQEQTRTGKEGIKWENQY